MITKIIRKQTSLLPSRSVISWLHILLALLLGLALEFHTYGQSSGNNSSAEGGASQGSSQSDKSALPTPPRIMSLKDMLSVALKQNPAVRAADANVRAAEAELDRTRLEVLRQIMAFREHWSAKRKQLVAAQEELHQAEVAMQTGAKPDLKLSRLGEPNRGTGQPRIHRKEPAP